MELPRPPRPPLATTTDSPSLHRSAITSASSSRCLICLHATLSSAFELISEQCRSNALSDLSLVGLATWPGYRVGCLQVLEVQMVHGPSAIFLLLELDNSASSLMSRRTSSSRQLGQSRPGGGCVSTSASALAGGVPNARYGAHRQTVAQQLDNQGCGMTTHESVQSGCTLLMDPTLHRPGSMHRAGSVRILTQYL